MQELVGRKGIEVVFNQTEKMRTSTSDTEETRCYYEPVFCYAHEEGEGLQLKNKRNKPQPEGAKWSSLGKLALKLLLDTYRFLCMASEKGDRLYLFCFVSVSASGAVFPTLSQ